jgi:hypothetical protein
MLLPFVANEASLATVDWHRLHPLPLGSGVRSSWTWYEALIAIISRFIQLISYACRQVVPHAPPLRCRVQFISIRSSVTMIGCFNCASAVVDTECGTVDSHSTHAAALEVGGSDVAPFVWSMQSFFVSC